MEAPLSKYDWRNLPTKIVAKIREHSQLPWLMLVDPDDSLYRRFYSFTKQMFLKIYLPRSLPPPPQTRRYYSSRGWLICVSRNLDKCTDTDCYFNISIFNPFANNNNVTIEAPLFHQIDKEGTLPWKDDCFVSEFGKFAVSVSPTDKYDNDDFVVAMTYGGCRNLAYWRLGHDDDSWNIVPDTLGVKNTIFQDLNFFNGELYATQWESRVIAFGSLKDNNPQPRVVLDMGFLCKLYQLPANMEGSGNNHYIVESKSNESGDEDNTSTLLFIYIYVDIESYDEHKYCTSTFKVFKLNVYNGNIEQVKSLGNQVIFVGFNSTFSVVVDDERGGCKPDCIYYTDDYTEIYRFKAGGGGIDMGIYSLQTQYSSRL